MRRSIALSEGDVHVLLGAQLLITLLVAGAFLALDGVAHGQAALYGGAVALLSAWLLGRRVRKATAVARDAPGQETVVLYLGAVQRFVLVLVLFGLGMGPLSLEALPLLVGFAAAQLGHVVNGARIRARG